jgi:hypothetical protein
MSIHILINERKNPKGYSYILWSIDFQASSQGSSVEKKVCLGDGARDTEYPCEAKNEISSIACTMHRN